ncbi:hypothetical protein B0A55_02365 [Friedmanniomyces simplex]|uniref:CTLH domain-containing protein n=1 Tax=Friedmanniomyces simplex TaxID=329884 RepID=A0A4U0XU48_9PEZI|nr:hypothetical protein B0A55_02365 [Friedmanniomyces simplex]
MLGVSWCPLIVLLAHLYTTPSALELDNTDPPPTSPIITAGPPAPSSQHPSPASQSTAPLHNPPTDTEVPQEAANDPSDPSGRPRKRRRRSSSLHESRTTPGRASASKQQQQQRQPKRRRAQAQDTTPDAPPEPIMRLEHTHEHRTRPSTNGSSANGSSPHTNGSSAKSSTETNGYHTNGHVEEAVTVRRQHDPSPFFGHDREEVTRILLQSLSDLGYHGAAKLLSSESGYELEIPSVAAFRSAVQQGQWEEAEALLFGAEAAELDGGVLLGNGHGQGHPSRRKSRASFGSQNGYARQGLPLAEGADTTQMKFGLRQQKYLELLDNRELNAALNVLRNELTPLKRDIGRLHALSSLMMCQSPNDLRMQAEWDGAEGDSRSLLLSEISKSISPSVMIPEHRLATLFTAVQEEQILGCRYHNTTAQPSLYTDHDCPAEEFPLQTFTELRNHSDEVWHVEFSHDGTMLATAGKDGLVCVYDTRNYSLRHEIREHDRNISGDNSKGVCYVAFSPDHQYLISCAQNNEFVVINVRDGRRVAHADHFDYPVTTAAWLPDSQTFVVGTQDSRRPLGLYSLRSATAATSTSSSSSSSSSVVRNNEIHSWRDPPWDSTLAINPTSFRITDCAVSPDGSRLVATTIDYRILVYDLGSRCKVAEWAMDDRLNSIAFGLDGTQLLLNMNEGRVLALSAGTGEVLMRYKGAKQGEFVIRSCFGGAGGNFVVSGSEDAKVCIWRRQTGQLVAALEAHGVGTVNAVAWHPAEEGVFASAGDDRRVRIWASAAAIRPPSAEAGAGASRTSLGYYGSAR